MDDTTARTSSQWEDDMLDYMYEQLQKSDRHRHLLNDPTVPLAQSPMAYGQATPDRQARVSDGSDRLEPPIARHRELSPEPPPRTPPPAIGTIYTHQLPTVPVKLETKLEPVGTNRPLHTARQSVPDIAEQLVGNLRVPQLPPFSGQDMKGDASFEVWQYELKCLVREHVYTESMILQAIRKSLKGTARDILLTVGDTASSTSILEKLEGIYGTVSSNETVIQQFYLEKQREDENVAQYSIRLEGLLQKAKNYTTPEARNEMLRSKLWSGLRDPQLKNATRFKYESEKDFNKLRRDIRAIEQDIATPAPNLGRSHDTKRNVEQQAMSSHDSLDSRMDELSKKFSNMESRFQNFQRLENRLNEVEDRQAYTNNRTQPHTYQHTRGYGRDRGTEDRTMPDRSFVREERDNYVRGNGRGDSYGRDVGRGYRGGLGSGEGYARGFGRGEMGGYDSGFQGYTYGRGFRRGDSFNRGFGRGGRGSYGRGYEEGQDVSYQRGGMNSGDRGRGNDNGYRGRRESQNNHLN